MFRHSGRLHLEEGDSALRKDCTDSVNVRKEVLLAAPPTKTEMFISGWFVHERVGLIWLLRLKV